METGMLNEDLNKSHWKHKLEEEQFSSAGKLPDKNAAWEKLHERLREKPRYRRIKWYWTAAACLLLLIFIPLIFINMNERNLVKNDHQKSEVPKPRLNQIQPVKERTVLETATLPSAKKSIIITIKGNERKPVYDNRVQPLKTNDTDKIEDDKVILQDVFMDSSMQTTTAITPLKKKLKVIHINELGDPVEEHPNIAHTTIHSFQFKLANQEAYVNPSANSNATGFNIPRLKTSPN
jgi:hypothetical protein